MLVTETTPVRLFGETGIQPDAALTSVRDAGGNAEYQGVVDELLRVRALGDDWDGQGAAAPRPDVVDSALRWILEMRANPRAVLPARVVPGVDGGIVLEWQAGASRLEVEISRPDRVEWMRTVPGQGTEHGEMQSLSGVVVE